MKPLKFIRIPTQDISHVVQKMLFKHNFSWGILDQTVKDFAYTANKEQSCIILEFLKELDLSHCSYDYCRQQGYTELSLYNLTRLLKGEEIKIADKFVYFMPGCIKVGCTNVSFATVEKIYKRMVKDNALPT